MERAIETLLSKTTKISAKVYDRTFLNFMKILFARSSHISLQVDSSQRKQRSSGRIIAYPHRPF
jgi:hypothetical protein